MRDITYAIQYTDYNQTDPTRIDVVAAKELFQKFDWSIHLKTFDEQKNDGGDPCPPNICFTDNVRRLWIWSDSQNNFTVVSNIKMKRKFLSIPMGFYLKDIDRSLVSKGDVIKLIEAYFDGQFDVIESFLTQS